MLWPLFALWFLVDAALWIGTGFLHIDYSLSLTLFPALFLVPLGGIRRGTFSVGSEAVPLVSTAWAAVVLAAMAAAGSAIGGEFSPQVTAFNALTGVGVLSILAFAWTFPADSTAIRRLLKILVWAAAINAVISAAQFLATNVLGIIPGQVFFANPHYPVILFGRGAKSLVRTPGIFQSGGVNASFMLIGLALSLSYVSLNRRAPRWWWLLISLQAALVMCTLTRRSFLSLALAFGIVGLTASVLRRRPAVLILSLIAVAVGLTGVIAVRPDLADPTTFGQRLGFWDRALFGVFGNHPSRLITGMGFVQSALPHASDSRLGFIDNGFLSLVQFGGLTLLAVFVLHFGYIGRIAKRGITSGREDVEWLALAMIVMLASFMVTMSLSSVTFNILEAGPFYLAISCMGQVVLSRLAQLEASVKPAV